MSFEKLGKNLSQTTVLISARVCARAGVCVCVSVTWFPVCSSCSCICVWLCNCGSSVLVPLVSIQTRKFSRFHISLSPPLCLFLPLTLPLSPLVSLTHQRSAVSSLTLLPFTSHDSEGLLFFFCFCFFLWSSPYPFLLLLFLLLLLLYQAATVSASWNHLCSVVLVAACSSWKVEEGGRFSPPQKQ